MAKEEIILRLGMLEREASTLQEKMQIVEQQILELQQLKLGLKELEKSKESAMLANIGKGIFIKTEVIDKELIVDVGNKTFVKKNINETLKIIEEQLEKLMRAKNQIIGKLQQLQREMENIIAEAEKTKEK